MALMAEVLIEDQTDQDRTNLNRTVEPPRRDDS